MDYVDIRSAFWRSSFEKAADYDDYVAQSPPLHANRWIDGARKVPPLTEEQKRRLTGHGRTLNVLLLSGIWCGDCVRQGPMIRRVVDACGEGVRLRVIDRDADARLRDELRIMGAMRVPVVVFLTEDFFEAGRYGDHTLARYRSLASLERVEGRERSQAAPPDDRAAEMSEWVDLFERMLLMARLSPILRKRYGD